MPNVPRVHTGRSCTAKVTIGQVYSRQCQRSFVPPAPCWDPSPRRVDHLHHRTPEALCGHPTTRATNQLVARLNSEHQGLWGASHTHQMEALQTDEQIAPIATIKRCGAATGRVRHRLGFVKMVGIAVRSSPRTSTYTYKPLTNTRSSTLNSEKPQSDRGVKM